MNRRRFLQAGASAVTCAVGAHTAEEQKRPNILFAIADDWSWPYASIAGDKLARTPHFDRVARQGVLFPHAYCVAPTCTASRGSILTGQWFARLEEGANLWSTLSSKFNVYPDLLEASGYRVGHTGKGWGPGDYTAGGRTRNPAGPEYNTRKNAAPTSGISKDDYAANFSDFLRTRSKEQPFCFWYGGREPHRPYEAGSGSRVGKDARDANVPACLPDVREVRSDILDYAVEIEWFDTHLGRMMDMLEQAGELDNTLIVVTGDNGMPFPRCKTNLYDCGTNVPLAICWGRKIAAHRIVDDFVSLCDLAPTFLEAAGVDATPAMTGRSLMPLLRSSNSGWVDPARGQVVVGRERHTPAQPEGQGGYPMRAIRTRDFLYIRNYASDRFPVGNDEGKGSGFKDIDNGPSKTYMSVHRNDAAVSNLFELGFGKRPPEELFDLRNDPKQQRNVAANPEYAAKKDELSKTLRERLRQWKDPRELGGDVPFDRYPYLGKKQGPN